MTTSCSSRSCPPAGALSVPGADHPTGCTGKPSLDDRFVSGTIIEGTATGKSRVKVSSAAGGDPEPLIPNAAGLTQKCQEAIEALDDNFAASWASIAAQCEAAKQDPNVENILSRVRMMLAAVGNGDTLSGLGPPEIGRFEETVRQTIARIVTPDHARIPSELPHRAFGQWLARTARQHPVEIFTVNYDILIELALEAERIPVFDGFVGSYQPFFHADSVRRKEAAPGVNWVRLWKMHGSVTWRRVEYSGHHRVVRGTPDPSGEMIFPSFEKYDESRQQPYAAMMDRLGRFLELDDALLIVAGFSFGDEHINNAMFSALENRPRTHVYALQFAEEGDESELVKRSLQRRNLVVIGPETGIIGGARAVWSDPAEPASVSAAFEVPRAAEEVGNEGEDENAVGLPGRMKIGDFSALCTFLSSMTAE